MAGEPHYRVATLHQDVITGVVLLVLCALAFLPTMWFQTVPVSLSQNVPPTFFPRLVLGIIAVLSVVLIGRGLRRSRYASTTIRPTVFVTVSVMTLAVALLETLGMMVTTFLLAVVLPLCWGERRFQLIGSIAVGLPLLIHFVFNVALGVRFPRGIITPWLW